MHVLVLAIGGNPLPNYISGKYFLSQIADNPYLPRCDCCVMIFSGQTEKYYFSVRHQLEKEFPLSIVAVNILDHERDLAFLQVHLIDVLHQMDHVESVNLNYTGGTKPMAIQNFITTNKFCSGLNIPLILTDLDPEQYKFHASRGNTQETPESLETLQWPEGLDTILMPDQGDLRDVITISLPDLFALHQIKYLAEKTANNKYYSRDLAEAIFEFEDPQALDMFRPLRNAFAENGTLKKNKLTRENGVQKNQGDKYWNFRSYQDVIENLPFKSQLPKLVPFDERDPATFSQKVENWRSVAFLVTGDWMEELIFGILLSLPISAKFQFSRNVKGEFNHRPMEIDLIGLRGYQMFLISITTSANPKDVKQKAFEALYRAEELGGLHAKSIVISLTDPEGINQVKNDLIEFNAEKNIRLLGRKALALEFDTSKDPGRISNQLTRILNGEDWH